MSNIMVSVCVLSYNHEKYLRDCLEGIVMQRTMFPIEAWVHDDASTDSSQEIIKEYQNRYPDIIKPILQTENQYSKKEGSVLQNHVYPHCTGKYIALCEGDDYWTDPMKLQKQVDFLESHPDYSLCFHEVKVFNQVTQQYEENTITRDVPCSSDIAELAKGNYIHTPSVMYRYNPTVNEKIESLGYCMPGDYVVWMLNAERGKIWKMEEPMAVYRVGSGVWSGRKGIGNDLSMLVTLTKLWAAIPKVRNELWEQIQMQKSYMIKEDNQQRATLEGILKSTAYRLGKMILHPNKLNFCNLFHIKMKSK